MFFITNTTVSGDLRHFSLIGTIRRFSPMYNNYLLTETMCGTRPTFRLLDVCALDI